MGSKLFLATLATLHFVDGKSFYLYLPIAVGFQCHFVVQDDHLESIVFEYHTILKAGNRADFH